MFFPLRHTPEDIYGSKDFHIWIQDNFLYITIFFPLSPMARQLNLYKIIPTAFPLPHQPEYYTRAVNLPKFVGFHDDEELFITFPDHLPQIEPSNLFYMQHSEHALLNKSRESCLSAIITRNLGKISVLCKFEFQTNTIPPLIVHVDVDTLLLVHVPSYTLVCPDMTSVHVPEPYVEVQIPCSCSFQSEVGNFPGRIMQCDPNVKLRPTYQFPVHLPLLINFFSDNELSHLTSSELTEPLSVVIPNITIIQTDYDNTMKLVNSESMELRKVANLTQQDAKMFRSAADKLRFDMSTSNLPIQSSSLSVWSWQTLLLLPTTAIAVLLSFIVYFLSGRLQALTLTVNLLSHASKVAAHPVPRGHPGLNYFLGTTMSPLPPSLFPFQLDYKLSTLDMLLLLVLVITIIFFGIQWYRHYVIISNNFQLFLEVGNPQMNVLIHLLTLPHNPLMYDISVQNPPTGVLLSGWFWPEVQLDWNGISIQDRHTQIVYPMPHKVRITCFQAYRMRQILLTGYYSLLFQCVSRRLTPIKIPRQCHVIPPPPNTSPSLYPHHMLRSYVAQIGTVTDSPRQDSTPE